MPNFDTTILRKFHVIYLISEKLGFILIINIQFQETIPKDKKGLPATAVVFVPALSPRIQQTVENASGDIISNLLTLLRPEMHNYVSDIKGKEERKKNSSSSVISPFLAQSTTVAKSLRYLIDIGTGEHIYLK